nr:ABC transporter permease subunit [Clostridia bacterium]
MISKPLLKQSCKANGLMWAIITFAVCFMLVAVMLIAGNGNLSKTKVAVENAMIKAELTAGTKKRALNYYELSNGGLYYFDQEFKTDFIATTQTQDYQDIYAAQGENAANAYAAGVAYGSAATKLRQYCAGIAAELGYQENSIEAQEILGIIMYVFNPMVAANTYQFDDFYLAVGETAPRYDFSGALTMAEEERAEYIEDYAFNNSTIFLAGNMVSPDNVQKVLTELKAYGITAKEYADFGFTDYANVKDIARTVVINYRANLADRLTPDLSAEEVQRIRDELKADFTESLTSSLPKEVADALEDIGSMDLYGILVGSVFFKIAGLLLPIIYMIMAANNLIAGQVDSGSMAYVLSTPTKRSTVSATQALYLIGSLFLMFVCTAISSVISIFIVDVKTDLNAAKLLLINLNAFIVMFAMSGIAFLASSVFNRSKKAMSIGGGLNIFFLVATILGLFGSPVIPSVIRMDSLKYFNYVSIISLFDVVSILDGTLTFLWKIAILIAIGCVCYVIAFKKFKEKDLPL